MKTRTSHVYGTGTHVALAMLVRTFEMFLSFLTQDPHAFQHRNYGMVSGIVGADGNYA